MKIHVSQLRKIINETLHEIHDEEPESSSWFEKVFSKAKDVALTDIGGPEGILKSRKPVSKKEKTKTGDDFKKWQAKRVRENTLRKFVECVVKEMKLGLTSQMRGNNVASFSPSKDEFVRDKEADAEDSFWLDQTDTSALGTKDLDIPKKRRD